MRVRIVGDGVEVRGSGSWESMYRDGNARRQGKLNRSETSSVENVEITVRWDPSFGRLSKSE